jgi:adenosine kinase
MRRDEEVFYMRPLISGSLAFDFIMSYDGRFAEQLRRGRRRGVNAAFMAPTMRLSPGGCGGNIAYSLALLGARPLLLATVGGDFASHRKRLSAAGVDSAAVLQIPNSFTARAFIATDIDGSQITMFHPGAMAHTHRASAARFVRKASLAIVSPSGKEGMLRHAREIHTAKVPLIFDPGQGAAMFNAKELGEFMDLADCAVFNRFEWELMKSRAKTPAKKLREKVSALIITDGANGSAVRAAGKTYRAPALILGETKDPTGCGDAYRAGFIYAMLHKWDWQTAANFGALLAGIKARRDGGQSHRITIGGARKLYKKHFGKELPR